MTFLGARGYLQSPGWLPHSGTAYPDALFASYWPLLEAGADGPPSSAAWTVIGRGGGQLPSYPKHPTLTNIPPSPPGITWHYYDLWAGKELQPSDLTLTVENDGYGGMLATPNSTADDPELAALLATMANLTKTPLSNVSNVWHYELGRVVEKTPAVLNETAAMAKGREGGMVKVDGGKYLFAVSGVEIEGAGKNYNDPGRGVDIQ
jgi:iron(II)-dependent oxidoreductase